MFNMALGPQAEQGLQRTSSREFPQDREAATADATKDAINPEHGKLLLTLLSSQNHTDLFIYFDFSRQGFSV